MLDFHFPDMICDEKRKKSEFGKRRIWSMVDGIICYIHVHYSPAAVRHSPIRWNEPDTSLFILSIFIWLFLFLIWVFFSKFNEFIFNILFRLFSKFNDFISQNLMSLFSTFYLNFFLEILRLFPWNLTTSRNLTSLFSTFYFDIFLEI